MTEIIATRDALGNEETRQYLTFSLDGEEYGLDILKVQEIKGYTPTTRIPNAPPHVTGVLNLRGTIVPLIDLRSKFGLEPLEYTRFNAIIVLNVGVRTVGIIVDSVSEVVSISGSQIESAPTFGESAAESSVDGMAKFDERLIVLLNVETVLKIDSGALALAA